GIGSEVITVVASGLDLTALRVTPAGQVQVLGDTASLAAGESIVALRSLTLDGLGPVVLTVSETGRTRPWFVTSAGPELIVVQVPPTPVFDIVDMEPWFKEEHQIPGAGASAAGWAVLHGPTNDRVVDFFRYNDVDPPIAVQLSAGQRAVPTDSFEL